MKKSITGLILLLLLASACKKTIQLDLRGTIKGEVYAIDEFGFEPQSNENIMVSLEGSEPLLYTLSDNNGKYEITDIPSGTYNLIISKEGYGDFQYQGIQVVGGDAPLYFNNNIVEKSSITIDDISLEVVDGTEIYLKCIVNHNYTIDPRPFYPEIRYYISDTDNPSYTNYIQAGTIRFEGESGSQLEARIYIDTSRFPSGSNVYLIAYGCGYYVNMYYDIPSNKYVISSLGEPSDIASIIAP